MLSGISAFVEKAMENMDYQQDAIWIVVEIIARFVEAVGLIVFMS